MDNRSNSNLTSLWTLTVCALVLMVSAWPALAQTRSETGRHKPLPSPPEEKLAEDDPIERPVGHAPRWHVGVLGGIQGGGDLFRVEVANGTPVPWESMTRFQSSRFTATLDRNFSLGLFVARDLGPVWTVRADIGYSRMDVAAEALVGQSGAVFLFDRMDVVNAGLGMEARLTRGRSYPFIQGALLVSRLDPGRAEELAQTNWGARLGLGYLHSFEKIWGVRLEARLSRTGFSTGDYVPQADTFGQPEINFEPADHLVFFEFLIGLQASF